tara:strand:+ start:45 stop:686 length:642 start_codon:yes stop_codon:yes gene_type:complete
MKKIFLLTGILIFSCKNPSTLDSKIQKESPNYTVSCDLVYDYERAKQFTLKYLDAMPEEYYSFKPTPEILSFREEAIHLGLVNYRYAAMIAGSYDASNEKEIMSREELQYKQDVVKWVSESYEIMINQIKLEDDLSAGTYYYRWSCSKECLARKGFEHQSHHRGKFAIYLRLKGIKPPFEQLIFQDGDRTPKDIEGKTWRETNNFKKYKKIVD